MHYVERVQVQHGLGNIRCRVQHPAVVQLLGCCRCSEQVAVERIPQRPRDHVFQQQTHLCSAIR